ncbi:MAG TPA: farnesyl diphosphate synthase [Alphaproteobacteria bacterium]|jgi:farnesyl diphosphate synthase|nr:farnesyl diphosphate synthase [Alphaproteobacteria bacterium]
MADAAAKVGDALDALLPRQGGIETRLFEAMRYATLGGGKRFRPFLLLESARMFLVAEACALRAAAALEMVHCYSLIHDDLPAMDDDDMRRGRPTTHKEFDEATAILAGDALLTTAFEVLADPLTHADPQVRGDLVLALARAAGAEGMAGGQMIDLLAETRSLDIGAITRLQRLKTGALIAFACEAGAILGKAPPSARHALIGFAHDLGLAFQMADDLLDAEGSSAETGKRTAKDAKRGKATFIAVLGAERARAQAMLLAQQAAAHLDLFGEKADLLRAVVGWTVERRA